MTDRNCDLLFEFLRSILYDSKIQSLDPEQLEEPFRKLGYGLCVLQQAVEELKTYTDDLSKGNLSGPYPSRENFLCSNLKNLHANLNHLTWQAKQVASGDYSQHVSYLGDFSDAFNTMTAQLMEREQLLKEEARKEKERAEMAKAYNDLLINLTQKREEWILVIHKETEEIMYCNKKQDNQDTCNNCDYAMAFQNHIRMHANQKLWKVKGNDGRYFQVQMFPVEWQGCMANAYIISDVTDENQNQIKLITKAYHDSLTGIYNRLFFKEYLDNVLLENQPAILCYMDLDGLKYVNDHFGHSEGDAYLNRFVSVVQTQFRSTDMFARIGGDEFVIILPACSKLLAERKLEKALHLFSTMEIHYPMSFSYGLVEITKEENRTMKQLLDEADHAMYECKKRNREKYKTVALT